MVQVRMWTAEHGATYWEALDAGGQSVQSETFSFFTGGSGEPPSLPFSMVGLTSASGLARLVTFIDGDTWVIQGNTARFSVEHIYLGPRPASYQWQRESQEGEWVDLPEATGATLELGPVDFGDAGNYRAFVDVGCTSLHSFPIVLQTGGAQYRFYRARVLEQ